MAEKIKVMQMVGSPEAGGAETFALRLLTALARQPKIEQRVVVRRGSWLGRELRAAEVEVFEVPFGGWWDGILGISRRRVQRLADEFGPDVVQSWMNRATRDVPVGPWVRVGRLGGFYKLKNYFNKVDYLIGNTEQIREYCVRGGWMREKVKYLPNFVPEPPQNWRKVGDEVRAELGIGPTARVMLQAGRLHEVKGGDVALRALAKLPEDVVLVLAGEGPMRENWAKKAEELGVAGRVRFVGWVSEIWRLAAVAEVWLAPSSHEPLGNTVLDAWVHGVPMVASETGGLAGLIEDGVSGILVPVGRASKLAAAVERVLADKALAKRLVAGGRAVFDDRFSEAQVVEEYVDYYAKLKKIAMKKGLKG